MVRAARQQLRAASDDVAAQVHVVATTAKKQRLMGTLELAAQLRRVRALGGELKCGAGLGCMGLHGGHMGAAWGCMGAAWGCMGLHAVCVPLPPTPTTYMPAAHTHLVRQHHEAGDYGEAILAIMEAGQALEGPLAGLSSVPALREGLTRHYYDTLQRLDGGLLRCCGGFCAEGYSKVWG